MNSHLLFSVVGPIVGFFVILLWRVRETQSPVTIIKIVAPPLGMSTGFCMFFAPPFRLPWSWALVSLAIGATVLAYPLLRTTRLWADVSKGTVMVKRSPAFFLVFVILALVRFFARAWIGQYISVTQTAALFYLLAFGMIVHWRIAMVRQFLRVSCVATS